jgi:CBS domain containing-hemolysin-like protein
MSLNLVLAVVGLLLINAFFVGAEFAIISARRSSIEPRAQAGSRAAKTVLWAMENVSLMLACAQLGITVASVSLGVVAEPAIAHALEPIIHDLGLPESAAHVVALLIALAIIVSLHVVIGEMVPKNAAVASPDRAALIFGPPLVIIARVLRPIIAMLNWIANCIVKSLGVQPRDEVASTFTADEVQSIVALSHAEGTLQDPAGLLTGAIEFSDHNAADVMVPIAKVVNAPAGVTVEGLEQLAVATGYSRFPVADGDAYLGYLHIKDTLFARPTEREEPIHAWRIRSLPVVKALDEVEHVLASMRRTGAHIALVVDADGPVGLVFLEDIIEELVGEVSGTA